MQVRTCTCACVIMWYAHVRLITCTCSCSAPCVVLFVPRVLCPVCCALCVVPCVVLHVLLRVVLRVVLRVLCSILVIIRSRDATLLATCPIIVDVGAVYDASTGRYDHHQRGFSETLDSEHTMKLSSAGLIYKHFGKEVSAMDVWDGCMHDCHIIISPLIFTACPLLHPRRPVPRRVVSCRVVISLHARMHIPHYMHPHAY